MAFKDDRRSCDSDIKNVGAESSKCSAESRSLNESNSVDKTSSPDKASGFARSQRTRLLVAVSYAACCLIWGTTWFAIRVSIEPGDGYPPNFAGAIRFVIAFILYLPLWLVFAKNIHRPTLLESSWVFLAGLLNGLYQCFVYSSECTISGGLASVIMATSPLMVALMAICTGFEKVRKQTLISFIICFAGVTLVCLDRMHTAAGQALGIIFALVAAFFTSLSTITLKGRCVRMHPVVSATIFVLATDIPVWIASFLCGEKAVFWPIPTAPMLALVYMAVMSSVVAFSFYLYMIRHMSLMGISSLQFVLPVLALAVDMFLEKRVTLTPQVWMGVGIVLTGVVLSLRRG